MAEAKWIKATIEDGEPEAVDERRVDVCEIVRDGYVRQITPEGQEDRILMISAISDIIR